MSVEFNAGTLSGISLTEGSVAPPFQMPDYATELTACMRYYRRTSGATNTEPSWYGYGVAGQTSGHAITFPVPMRAAPTITKTGTWGLTNCSQPVLGSSDTTSYLVYVTVTAAGAANANPLNSGVVYFNARM